MSANLGFSATLSSSSSFRARVRAAVTERAVGLAADTSGDFSTRAVRSRMVAAALADSDALVSRFAALCADDAVISAASSEGAVEDADLRRVVAAMWLPVAASTPGL